MLERYRLRNPGYSLPHILAYDAGWWIFRTWFTLVYDLRFQGQEHVPPLGSGGLIVVANHQSHYDPPMMAVGTHRHFHFIAKVPLFTNPAFGAVIRLWNAIPLNQEKGDTAAMRTAIEHLEKGRIVLIYPEGARTHDGALNEFKPGVGLLIKRAKAPVLPMAVEGAFDVWPRFRARPRLRGKLRVEFGPVIPYPELEAAGARGMLDLLKNRIDAMRLELRHQLRHATRGRYPAPGPGDLAHDDPALANRQLPPD